MARPVKIDVSAIVSRELIRLGVQNIPLADFRAQAEMSDEEKIAFDNSLHQRSPLFYVDAVNFSPPVAMVGTFTGGTE